MLYAVAYVVFILLFTTWLGGELKRKYSLKSHWGWIAGAVFVGIVGQSVSTFYDNNTTSNFVLHASGGVSSVLLFVYLVKTLRLHFSWQLATVLMFGFVSTLGVLNELAEYTGELLGFGPFSFDAHDTWRDLTANSVGAMLTWAIYSFVKNSQKI